MPVEEPIDAIAVLLLVQLPPVVVLFNVTTEPTHIVVVPVIGAGFGFMVTMLVPVEVQIPLETEAV
jgi:type IV secretory pathway VirB3-like protein